MNRNHQEMGIAEAGARKIILQLELDNTNKSYSLLCDCDGKYLLQYVYELSHL